MGIMDQEEFKKTLVECGLDSNDEIFEFIFQNTAVYLSYRLVFLAGEQKGIKRMSRSAIKGFDNVIEEITNV